MIIVVFSFEIYKTITMKKIFSLLTVLLITACSFAQINEGKVKYNLEFNSPDPAMQAQFAMLKGSTMQMYFSPEFNRVEMNMGMFVQSATIVDIKGKQSVMTMDGMMGKKATKMSTENTETEETPDVEVEKTTESKKVAGYKCTKYIITTEDGSVVNMWVTNELVSSKEGMQFVDDKIQGFPLEFEVAAEGMTMVFSAIEVEKGLKKYNKKDIFNMSIPEGYEVINAEDWKGMGM